ncbi:MAG TPA: hypothetical protein VFJ90_01485 [Candidatus Didemnitutus sp.]|nr:hypothetical protein [Candidatus Didemnitutus sp.]
MNTRVLLSLGVLALALPARSGAQPSPLEKTRQARSQIDILLGPRRNAPPPPVDPPNPFTLPGAAPTTPDPGATVSTPAETTTDTQEILARAMKFSGTVMIGGRQQLIVNQLSYKEGDMIAVRDNDQVLRVRLVRIAPPSAVFELNGTEVILRIKN